MKNFLINCALVLCSLILLFLFSEYIIFGIVFKPADYPELASNTDVLRYRPNQTGTYRVKNEIESAFSINQQGWNSGHQSYAVPKSTRRIAVIGDSFINAIMVDYDKSVAEQLEGLSGGRFEVFRFGIDGAPLSQYLYMLENEVLKYQPDVVVFNLVHNDFDESYKVVPGVYTNAFMKLRFNNGEIQRIGPHPFVPRWYSFIRNSNLWRFFAVREQVRFSLLREFILGKARKDTRGRFQANIDTSTLEAGLPKEEAATFYVLEQAQRLCRERGIRFVVLMDGNRHLIYSNPEGPFDYSGGALRLNAMVGRVAGRLGVEYVDLHRLFAQDYADNGKRFEYANDNHWNERGHAIAAQALYEILQTEGGT